MEPIKNIICVHQGYELYGSDRSFIQCVEIIRNLYKDATLVVVIPKRGLLFDELVEAGFQVCVDELWILRKTSIIRDLTFGIFRVIFSVYKARKNIKKYDLVYVNTAVVADYLIATRLAPKKVIAHIREIPVGIARTLLRNLVVGSGASLIFNSQATLHSYTPPPTRPSTVIHNAFVGPSNWKALRRKTSEALNIVMLGRLNSWKGQDLLIEAISLAVKSIEGQLRVRIIGGVFEEQAFDELLRLKIQNLGLDDVVSIEPFMRDPSEAYEWSHVVVVPSILPEPFGRVAIEAMAFARPVIAANHGGLSEIVLDHKTGLLFRPNDAADLARKIVLIHKDRSLNSSLGEFARLDFQTRFTLEGMQEKLRIFLDATHRKRSLN